ncbi:MAG: hypothetical protein ABFS46_09730 [Myxococcota bacterium]
MAQLHPKDRSALDSFTEDLRRLHGDSLVAALLTGEAASGGYRPRRSPLSTVVVLSEVTVDVLRRTRPRLRGWRRRRIPTPLLMDPAYIESAIDVFPIEFLEIADHHLLLSGDGNPFADLTVHLPHLRLEVEEQIRGKMLHLWEAYLEAGGSKRMLRRLLLETPPGFEMILRGMLRLQQGEAEEGPSRPDAPSELLADVERRFELELPVFRRLERVREGAERLPRHELESVFESYLAEVRRLVRVTDAL